MHVDASSANNSETETDVYPGIIWPAVVVSSGSISNTEPLQQLIDSYARIVREVAVGRQLPQHLIPLFGACSFYMFVATDGLYVAVTHASGNAREHADRVSDPLERVRLDTPKWLKGQTGETAIHVIEFPFDDDGKKLTESLGVQARKYVSEVEFELMVGDNLDSDELNGIEPEFRAFLADHPDIDKNVFVMMSFSESEQMTEVFSSIRTTLDSYGLVALRADDRAYAEDVWPNIRVYLAGCKYGIAVFEDIDKREFNPNVAIEFGFMMAKGKRVLPLKEQRLPKMPSDLVSRLYREWNSYDITRTIGKQVGSWIERDLRLTLLPVTGE
jgi:hypothetical protein